MKRIILVRHAKSERGIPDLVDFDRPLNARGLRDAPRMAEQFVKNKTKVDQLVSSPALRARSTAAFFASALNADVPLQNPAIYDADLPSLIRVFCSLDQNWNSVMLFGHNPAFSEASSYLTGEPLQMPTCAVVVIDFSIDDWNLVSGGSGTLVSFDYPKKHNTI